VLASDPEPDITDTEAPVVTNLTPVSGTTCSNTVVLAADATDNIGVTRVEFLVNGVVAGTDTTAPYSFSWNSRSVANGSVTIQARAFDAAGNSAVTATATLTVANSGNNDNPWPGSWSGKLGATVYSDGVEFAVWWRNSVVSAVSVVGTFNGWNPATTPMTRVGSGDNADVWYAFVPNVTPGAEYQYVGTKSGSTNKIWVADIYSKYNRYSNGNSVVVDNTYSWTATGWQRPDWSSYIIYELHVKDFTSTDTTVTAAHRGKYLGVIEKLPYLKQLGITAIELMPVSEFPDVGYGWGYNTSLFGAPESGYAVNPALGQEGVDQLKALIDACHANGIAVIFDMVFNHVSNGDNHFWMMDKVAWFDFNNNGDPADDQTPWGNKFNTRHPRAHQLAKDICEYYMREFKGDGFRLDATHTDFMDHDFVRGLKSHLASIDSKVFFTMENLPNQSDLKTWGSQWAAEYRHRGKDILCGGNGIAATYFSKHIYYTADHGWSAGPVETLNYLESHDEDTLKYLFNIAGISAEGPSGRPASGRSCSPPPSACRWSGWVRSSCGRAKARTPTSCRWTGA
jgi:pullulanase/glycogen debranching enzyme